MRAKHLRSHPRELRSRPSDLRSHPSELRSYQSDVRSRLRRLRSTDGELRSNKTGLRSPSKHLRNSICRVRRVFETHRPRSCGASRRLDTPYGTTRLPHTGHHFRDAGPTSQLGNNWLNTSTDIADPPPKRTHTCHPRSDRYPTPPAMAGRQPPIADNTRLATLSAIHRG